jgi:hypothetical protein
MPIASRISSLADKARKTFGAARLIKIETLAIFLVLAVMLLGLRTLPTKLARARRAPSTMRC